MPPKGTFQPNNADDPLPYYYKPFIGSIYRSRIEQGLNLLTPPYESILEMGYGSGLLLPSLSDMCNSLSGIDLNSNPKQVGKILLKNKTIYYYHDDYEITKINLESIETIYKTFDDFYHISQRLSLFYNILMILFFPFIILNKFVLLLIKSFIHIKKCGFNKYPLYDAIIIREINNEVIAILPLCQNERDEIKKYFMSKLNIDIDKLDTHISFLYSLENINTGER